MNFYQIYWDDGFEASGFGLILSHSTEYSSDEMDQLVAEAISQHDVWGGTDLKSITEYLVKTYGFTSIDTLNINTK